MEGGLDRHPPAEGGEGEQHSLPAGGCLGAGVRGGRGRIGIRGSGRTCWRLGRQPQLGGSGRALPISPLALAHLPLPPTHLPTHPPTHPPAPPSCPCLQRVPSEADLPPIVPAPMVKPIPPTGLKPTSEEQQSLFTSVVPDNRCGAFCCLLPTPGVTAACAWGACCLLLCLLTPCSSPAAAAHCCGCAGLDLNSKLPAHPPPYPHTRQPTQTAPARPPPAAPRRLANTASWWTA